MPGIVRNLHPQVFFNGQQVQNVLSFRYNLSYEQAVGDASVVLAYRSDAGDYYDDVAIVVDGSTRWSGMLVEWDFSLYPRTATMVCKGRLENANKFRLPDAISSEQKGLQLTDLVGSATATDQQIVSAVLDRVGLDTNGGSIGGTGIVLGSIAPEKFVWDANDTALAYIQKIDAISLGYRTFESAGGSIFRTQISSVPSGSSFTFTEGTDIVEGSSSRTVQDAFNIVRVSGYSVGDYADPRVFVISEGTSSPTNRVYSLNNEMIERRADSSPGLGVSCEAVANYWIRELNRELLKMSMRTPRSDVFGPGQSHTVRGAGDTTDRLGIADTLWVQGVSGELRQDGTFSQTMTYIGGG